MEIGFKIVDRSKPIISIDGYVDVYDGSDYCMTFYDSFDDLCVRIPMNPFNYYTEDYYRYIDLVYHFECDEAFMPIVKQFAESEFKKFKFMRPYCDLILEKI